MKNLTKLFIIGLGSLLFQSCSEKKWDCNLIYKDKSSQLYFSRETDNVFTGKCEEIYGNGKPKYLKEYNEGYKVSTVSFYETGEKNFEENYDKAGMFTSSITYYKDGKNKTEEFFNSSNKNTYRIGYYSNGQISYQETISFDTLTYKTFQENGKPIIDKQAVINMNWTTYLKAGQSLSNTDTCIIDYKDHDFKGYLTYAKEYCDNGNPKYLLEFEKNHIRRLDYKFGFIKPDKMDLFKMDLYKYGNVPMLYILRTGGANKFIPKPNSKVFFENGKLCYESIQPMRCALFSGNSEIVGIHYNENGNIFAVQLLRDGSVSFKNLFVYENGAWATLKFLSHPMNKSLDVPINEISNLNQICGE